jgi:hypothetical protein
MDLVTPATLRERITRRLLAYALNRQAHSP